jgi:hypothetical protein
MIQVHYVPSWCGDYRLEADGDAKCVLAVTDPTAAEQVKLERFLLKCFSRGLVKPFVGIAGNGETKIEIAASIVEAGKLLLGTKNPRKGVLTAVKSVQGEVEAILAEEQPKLDNALAAPEAKEAVTTRRPTLCCPTPISGPDTRASQVLQAFCTEAQWNDWQKQGFVRCYGCFSGHRYRIVHRHSELARQQGKITWDETDDHVIHAYDWSVPPAEEVLSLKLAIEHAEHWVRNQSSAFGLSVEGTIDHAGKRDLYENPFVGAERQQLDGTRDAQFVKSFGYGMRVWLRMLQKLGAKR